MENNTAVKRPLEEGVEVDAKRLKTADDLLTLPSMDNIRSVIDPRKWSQLPSIVYELLALFKKSENVDSEVDDEMKNISDIEKVMELQVLKYENPEENKVKMNNTEFICHDESNKLSKFKSTIEHSIQSIKFDFFKNETENIEFQNNCLLKAEQKEDEGYKETSDFKELTSTKSVLLTNPCTTTSSESNHSTSTQIVSTQPTFTPKSVSCTPISPNTLSCTSTKNISGMVSSVSTPSKSIPMSVTISITPTSIPKIDSCTPIITTTVSGLPEEIVSTKSGPNNVYKVSLREQILNLLKVHCLNGISEISTTKPPPCICQYCKHVDNLPIGKSAINNKCTQFKNNTNLHTDMYSSDVAASDSETKDIWVNELCSLIRKNDESHKAPVPSTSKTLFNSVMSNVCIVPQKAKPHLSFCQKCKKSQLTDSTTCINCKPQLKKRYEYCNPPRYENRNYYHGNQKYRYY